MFCRWREALLVVQLARLSSSLVELPEPSVLPVLPVLSVLPEMRQVGTAGTALPNLLQVWLYLPNLQQVWFIYTKLAVSMAVQAILGAFPAALQSTTKFQQRYKVQPIRHLFRQF